MLRECRDDGFFRGETCPTCGDEGRFLMKETELDRIGRILAGVLRHFPDRFGVHMDPHGWVEIDELVDRLTEEKRALHWVRPLHIEAIALTDPKGRYQVEDERVRATYGHSIDVDLSDLPDDDVPDTLYYPVSEEELDIILERGLMPTDRRWVHLSGTYDSAVTAGEHRAEESIILAVDAASAQKAGISIRHAGTTVFITDGVPGDFLARAD